MIGNSILFIDLFIYFFTIIRWKEALDLKSKKYQTPLLGLIEHLPECVPFLFDRCITHSHNDRKHKEFHVKIFPYSSIRYIIISYFSLFMIFIILIGWIRSKSMEKNIVIPCFHLM
jgi:hypothetical protein